MPLDTLPHCLSFIIPNHIHSLQTEAYATESFPPFHLLPENVAHGFEQDFTFFFHTWAKIPEIINSPRLQWQSRNVNSKQHLSSVFDDWSSSLGTQFTGSQSWVKGGTENEEASNWNNSNYYEISAWTTVCAPHKSQALTDLLPPRGRLHLLSWCEKDLKDVYDLDMTACKIISVHSGLDWSSCSCVRPLIANKESAHVLMTRKE